MNPVSSNKIFRLGLAAAAALVVAAPAGAYSQPVDEADGAMAHYVGLAATDEAIGAFANQQAIGTFATQQTRTTAARTEKQILAQYGWGAAATYAKLHA